MSILGRSIIPRGAIAPAGTRLAVACTFIVGQKKLTADECERCKGQAACMHNHPISRTFPQGTKLRRASDEKVNSEPGYAIARMRAQGREPWVLNGRLVWLEDCDIDR